MEEKLQELIIKFGGEKINRDGKLYIKIPPEKSYSFEIHFKTLFPKKDLVFIFFDGKYDVWRVEERILK
ncbi:MAG: hypothetical protein ABIM60_01190 [candidate division WOR-3 bacterium]